MRGYDLNTLTDPPYVAMEYIPGVTLRQILQATATPPADEALAILRQILWSLVHAYEHGVRHRDLEPEIGRGRDRPFDRAAPRTDPYVQHYRIRLLPRVLA